MNTVINTELRGKLQRFSNLPSIHQIIVNIKQVANNPKSSPGDLANCILADHQLTSKILRMANSAHYGNYSGKINTVTHAIVLMGFNVVHNIAISLAVYEVINKLPDKNSFDITSFWTRSLACGVIAKFLARQLNKPKLIEMAFIAGFMHDIGQAILAGVFPDKYQHISNLDKEGNDICETEKVLLGIDHLEAGAFVASQWNLPESLIQPIAEHHRVGMAADERSSNVLVDLVYLADLLYPHVMQEANIEVSSYKSELEQVQQLIDVSKESVAELVSVCRDEVTEIARDLQINIDAEFKPLPAQEPDISEIHQQLNNQELQLAFLRNATSGMMESKQNDDILQIICEAVYRGLQMGRVIIFESDQRKKVFFGNVGFGLESQEAVRALSFSAKNGIFQQLADSGQSISVVDQNCDKTMAGEEFARLEAQRFALVPIKVLDNVMYAIFVDSRNRSDSISVELLGSIESLAHQAEVILERNLLLEKLKNQSPVDQLT